MTENMSEDQASQFTALELFEPKTPEAQAMFLAAIIFSIGVLFTTSRIEAYLFKLLAPLISANWLGQSISVLVSIVFTLITLGLYAASISMSYSPDERPGVLEVVARLSRHFYLYLFLFLIGYNLFSLNYFVHDDFMAPTLESGDGVSATNIPYLIGSPKRGDLVAIDDGTRFGILRVVASPGETFDTYGETYGVVQGVVLDGSVELGLVEEDKKQRQITLSNDEYLVVGDSSSPQTGLPWTIIQRRHIVGKVFWRYYPFTRLGILPDFSYPPNAIFLE